MSKLAKEMLAVVVVGETIVSLVKGGLVGFPVDLETPGAPLEIRCTAVAGAAAAVAVEIAAAAAVAVDAAAAVEPAALEIQFVGTPYTPLAEVPS